MEDPGAGGRVEDVRVIEPDEVDTTCVDDISVWGLADVVEVCGRTVEDESLGGVAIAIGADAGTVVEAFVPELDVDEDTNVTLVLDVWR